MMKRAFVIVLLLALALPQWAEAQVNERAPEQKSTPAAKNTPTNKADKRKARRAPRMDSPQRINTVLKSNPFSIMWGPIPFTAEYKLGYEVTTSARQSSQLTVSYLGKSPLFSLIESDFSNQQNNDIRFVVRGFRFQASQRFFIPGIADGFGLKISDYAPEGLYIAPHISYSTATISNRYLNQYDVYLRASHFNMNLHLGYQFSLGDRLMVEAFAGLGYKRNWWLERLPNANVQGIDTEELGPLYNGPLRISFGYTFGWAFY